MTRKLTDKELKILKAQNESAKNMADLLINTPIYNTKFKYAIPRDNYQEPERDEHGVFYGYKVLVFTESRVWLSPVRPTQWNRDGSIVADKTPSENNSNGIYATKREYDSEIMFLYHRHHYPAFASGQCFIVKVALFGTVIEGETGFRSEKAQIVYVKAGNFWLTFDQVLERIQYGNRQDSQDTQYTRSYPLDLSQAAGQSPKWFSIDPTDEP